MGKVFIVGIGPGNEENRTIRADRALEACDVIAGYSVYVDLVKDRYPGKELVSTPMTQEARRCQMVLDLAKSGKTVALVCSGDSGIYGMAALVYELRGENSEPEVEVVPGLTAACSGGAVLGAPLTHDFAVISLSDRLIFFCIRATSASISSSPMSAARGMIAASCEVGEYIAIAEGPRSKVTVPPDLAFPFEGGVPFLTS